MRVTRSGGIKIVAAEPIAPADAASLWAIVDILCHLQQHTVAYHGRALEREGLSGQTIAAAEPAPCFKGREIGDEPDVRFPRWWNLAVLAVTKGDRELPRCGVLL